MSGREQQVVVANPGFDEMIGELREFAKSLQSQQRMANYAIAALIAVAIALVVSGVKLWPLR